MLGNTRTTSPAFAPFSYRKEGYFPEEVEFHLPDDAVPPELQQFMSDYIQSYEQLEALLWLFSHRTETISTSSLAQTLRIRESVLEDAVERLMAAQLVSRAGGSAELLRYEPAGLELDASVSALAALYESDRLPIVRIMAENSIQRLRKSALHTFAECFLIGKPKNRG